MDRMLVLLSVLQVLCLLLYRGWFECSFPSQNTITPTCSVLLGSRLFSATAR